MKAPYKPWLISLLLKSENLQDTKNNLQRKMESLKNDNSYNMASCPVWKAIQTQKCPTGENLVSFDKTTKIFKMNVDTLTDVNRSLASPRKVCFRTRTVSESLTTVV